MPPLGGKIGRAASGVVLDIDHTKFNKISTKYRTQHFIAQNIDQQNFFKMSIIATLHISRPKHACSMLILARLFNILFLIFNFFSFNTLSSFEIYVSYNHCERFFDKYRPFKCNIDHKFKNIDQLRQMVNYRPMVDNTDPLAALNWELFGINLALWSQIWDFIGLPG